MIVVSGCPRSGTSLMMDIMRDVFGEDKIVGSKFPQEKNIDLFLKKHDGETEDEYNYRMYISKKQMEKRKFEIEKIKDLNPNGFWECIYTVSGIRFMPQIHNENQLIDIYNNIKKREERFCKIVSQGLSGSESRYIEKIIFMMRHPREVAKSQERLKRNGKFKLKDGTEFDIYEGVVVHSPEMYINVTVSAAVWLKNHEEIPFLIVDHKKLMTDPKPVLMSIQNFIGKGNFSEAEKRIDTSLYRSYPEDIDNELWEEAEYVYEKFMDCDFKAITEFAMDKKSKISRRNRSWRCERSGIITCEAHCKNCKTSINFRNSLKENAVRQKIEWQNQPCAFECAFDLDEEHVSVQESIEKNFWK